MSQGGGGSGRGDVQRSLGGAVSEAVINHRCESCG